MKAACIIVSVYDTSYYNIWMSYLFYWSSNIDFQISLVGNERLSGDFLTERWNLKLEVDVKCWGQVRTVVKHYVGIAQVLVKRYNRHKSPYSFIVNTIIAD